jgi:hypothetical protein
VRVAWEGSDVSLRDAVWPTVLLAVVLAVALSAPKHVPAPAPKWVFERSFEVEGRQGVATDGTSYFVSGSKALFVYDRQGSLLRLNRTPFRDLAQPANHIGDISVHAGKIYAGIEWFEDGHGTNIQVAVYDAESLAYERSIPWEPDSGQTEVSAVAIEAGTDSIWMTDWVEGRYLYQYRLSTGAYLGALHLRPVPQWQQGIAAFQGRLYVTADDGDAELGEHDNLWVVPSRAAPVAVFVDHVRSFTEFKDVGEIEGLDFDAERREMVVLANRGKRIVRGMPTGLAPGYDKEIHEVYLYKQVPGHRER